MRIVAKMTQKAWIVVVRIFTKVVVIVLYIDAEIIKLVCIIS